MEEEIIFGNLLQMELKQRFSVLDYFEVIYLKIWENYLNTILWDNSIARMIFM